MKYFILILCFFLLSACEKESANLSYELASQENHQTDLQWTKDNKNGIEFGSYAINPSDLWFYSHAEKSSLYGLFLQNINIKEFSFQMQVSPYPFENSHKIWYRNSFGLKFSQTPCVDAWMCFVMEAPQENLEIRLYNPDQRAILSMEDVPEEEQKALKDLLNSIYMRF